MVQNLSAIAWCLFFRLGSFFHIYIYEKRGRLAVLWIIDANVAKKQKPHDSNTFFPHKNQFSAILLYNIKTNNTMYCISPHYCPIKIFR